MSLCHFLFVFSLALDFVLLWEVIIVVGEDQTFYKPQAKWPSSLHLNNREAGIIQWTFPLNGPHYYLAHSLTLNRNPKKKTHLSKQSRKDQREGKERREERKEHEVIGSCFLPQTKDEGNQSNVCCKPQTFQDRGQQHPIVIHFVIDFTHPIRRNSKKLTQKTQQICRIWCWAPINIKD